MKYHNEIEEEIDAIRDKLYITIKDMTSGERIEYINARAREIMKKYGIITNIGMDGSQAPNHATNDTNTHEHLSFGT